ncbi:hypothetical protein EW146_g4146 [Bondarzewia mesenterica]|uniref:Uncharacterized protein n=1 Tax=Bondarzewia mesenterica TaxID=1095465 RepID=A0A4S4LVE0_9AGAM|nr:hypothetical protein EW146_g4146 [Bondarzewia mesenterica]
MGSRSVTGRVERVEEEEMGRLKELWDVLERIVWSRFFQDIEKSPENFSGAGDAEAVREYVLLKKVRRRMWRVLRYRTVPVRFVEKILPQLKDALEMCGEDGITGMQRFLDGSGGICVCWVPSDAPLDTVVRFNPQSGAVRKHAWSLVASYGTAGERGLNASVGAFLDGLDMCLLDNEDSVCPRVHCELRLVAYLVEHGIAVYKDTIGASKLLCWACYIFVEELRAVLPQRRWRVSGTSGKAREDWGFVSSGSVSALEDAVERVRVRVRGKLREVLVDR